jgi:chromosome segregation ATPase
MVEARQPTIADAIDRVDDEIALTRTEKEAFDSFLNRISEVQLKRPHTGVTSAGSTVMASSNRSTETKFKDVRRAYRRTVMEMSHYKQEYDDTLSQSLSAELGDTLASYVMNGKILTPAIHEALCTAAKECSEGRKRFLCQLQQERDSLEEIATDLNKIESRLVELDDSMENSSSTYDFGMVDESLREMEHRCTELASQRQQFIHNRGGREISGFDGASLSNYLYAGLETHTPAISDIVSCLSTIRQQREYCLR